MAFREQLETQEPPPSSLHVQISDKQLEVLLFALERADIVQYIPGPNSPERWHEYYQGLQALVAAGLLKDITAISNQIWLTGYKQVKPDHALDTRVFAATNEARHLFVCEHRKETIQ